MKLVVRSKEWRSIICGQLRHSTWKVPALKPYTAFSAQIDFRSGLGISGGKKRGRSYWGCCIHRGGQRVIELEESHFLDAHKGKWDLYRSSHFIMPKGDPTHEFFLMPDNQTSINVQAQKGWELWGSIDACIMRMELELLFQPLIEESVQEKKRHGRMISHAHLTVLMDQIEEKDPPMLESPCGKMELNTVYYDQLSYKGKHTFRMSNALRRRLAKDDLKTVDLSYCPLIGIDKKKGFKDDDATSITDDLSLSSMSLSCSTSFY